MMALPMWPNAVLSPAHTLSRTFLIGPQFRTAKSLIAVQNSSHFDLAASVAVVAEAATVAEADSAAALAPEVSTDGIDTVPALALSLDVSESTPDLILSSPAVMLSPKASLTPAANERTSR